MAYYYPYGYTPQTADTSNWTNVAITASITASANTQINSVTYAATTQSSGASGSAGVASTSASCAAANPSLQAPQGPAGPIGASGSRGPSLTSCPSGSVPCSNLTPPDGYAIVCIQTDGCGGITVCPETLP